MKKKWLVISALAIINVACFLLFFFMARTVYDNSSAASKELHRIIYAVEQNKSNENFKTGKYSFTIQQSAPITKLYDRQYTYYVTDTETGGKNERYVFMKYENTKQNTTKVYVSSRMNSTIADWTYEKYAGVYILLAIADTFILWKTKKYETNWIFGVVSSWKIIFLIVSFTPMALANQAHEPSTNDVLSFFMALAMFYISFIFWGYVFLDDRCKKETTDL